MSNQAEFFFAGGTLQPDAPSYLRRPADQALLESLRSDSFCYVLTARNMGKSSLMMRTAAQLGGQGVQTATIDLSKIESTSVDSWYPSLLEQLRQALSLKTAVTDWWKERQNLSASQRFVTFVREVLLREVPGNLVLFFDEIDTMLRLDFRDDFFAAIRAIYNARASEPAYKRITFTLLGVATPLDLIRDPSRTPFNIGRAIELHEFAKTDLEPFQIRIEAQHQGQAQRILKRIFHWTNGHPYLTQKLCVEATKPSSGGWGDPEQAVDRLVAETFFGDKQRTDQNLKAVSDSITRTPNPERAEMLEIYQAVYSGEPVPHKESSQAQNHLEIYGLVRVERGRLVVRNEIYRKVFDERWIKSLKGVGNKSEQRSNTMLWIIIGVVILAILGGGVTISSGFFAGQPTATSISVIDTATATTTIPDPTNTVEMSITSTTTSASPTPTTTLEPTPTPTQTPEPIATSTPQPTATSTPQPTATSTPEPPTPTTGPFAECTVLSAVTVNSRPQSGNSIGVSLDAGTNFRPVALSGSITYPWVQVPPNLIGGRIGWVYAGNEAGLVRCTGLDLL